MWRVGLCLMLLGCSPTVYDPEPERALDGTGDVVVVDSVDLGIAGKLNKEEANHGTDLQK